MAIRRLAAYTMQHSFIISELVKPVNRPFPLKQKYCPAAITAGQFSFLTSTFAPLLEKDIANEHTFIRTGNFKKR